MKKYVCKRNEVMAGKLVMVLPSISTYEDSFEGYEYINARTMLYNLANEGKGKDLIYTRSNSPIIYDIDTKDIEHNNDGAFYITSNIELEELLKYLKFNKDLTQKDLNKIFNILLKHKAWLKNHSELFGIIYDIFGNYIIDEKNSLFTPDMYFRLRNLQEINTKPKAIEYDYQLIKKNKR